MIWERTVLVLTMSVLVFLVGYWAYREPQRFHPRWPRAERFLPLIHNRIRRIAYLWMGVGALVFVFEIVRTVRRLV